jgi:uncharacterized protein with PQ loop repeat
MELSATNFTILLGLLGAFVSCTISLPQAMRAWRDPAECLIGISAWTWRLMALNALIWLVWALLVGQICAGLPSLINGPAALAILWRTRRL